MVFDADLEGMFVFMRFMDERWSSPARDWQANVTQEKLNNRAFGLGPPYLVTGIDGGDGDAEFLAPPLDDLNVARVMEEMSDSVR